MNLRNQCNLNILLYDEKNVREFDRIYNFDNENEKILFKKFRSTNVKNSTSLIFNNNEGNFGIEILNIPKYYIVHMGLIILDKEINKFKFHIKLFDTYGKEVDNIETNNLLNLVGINLRIYLPNYTKEDEVGLFLINEQDTKFKNRPLYNQEIQGYETNYNDKIGMFEVKGYKSNIKLPAPRYLNENFNVLNTNEKIDNFVEKESDINDTRDDSEEKSVGALDVVWICVLSVIGGLFLIFIIYIIYYFLVEKRSIEDYNKLDYMGANGFGTGISKSFEATGNLNFPFYEIPRNKYSGVSPRTRVSYSSR